MNSRKIYPANVAGDASKQSRFQETQSLLLNFEP